MTEPGLLCFFHPAWFFWRFTHVGACTAIPFLGCIGLQYSFTIVCPFTRWWTFGVASGFGMLWIILLSIFTSEFLVNLFFFCPHFYRPNKEIQINSVPPPLFLHKGWNIIIMLLHPVFFEMATTPYDKIHLQSRLVICPLASQVLRIPSGSGCRPAGTSGKVMEVGVAAERFALRALFRLIGLLAPWVIEEGAGEAMVGVGGVTRVFWHQD